MLERTRYPRKYWVLWQFFLCYTESQHANVKKGQPAAGLTMHGDFTHWTLSAW